MFIVTIKARRNILVQSSTISKKLNENPSVKSHATVHGDGAGYTDNPHNVNNDGQPITARADVSVGQQTGEQPITARPPKSSVTRPITARSVVSPTKPAEIQTRVVDPDSGRLVHPNYLSKGPIISTKMFKNWTPDLLGPPTDDRPVRSTRNKNPNYIDAIWSASQAEIDLINQSVSRKLTLA